jgi:hypothetical protein
LLLQAALACIIEAAVIGASIEVPRFTEGLYAAEHKANKLTARVKRGQWNFETKTAL